MGIKGSSTVAVYFDNVKVPVENVLGEIGRGHIIAFNILNLGRLKLGRVRAWRRRKRLRSRIKYAKERKAFGKSICRVRHDPAQAGRDGDPHLCDREHDLSRGRRDSGAPGRLSLGGFRRRQQMLKAVEEFAAECSFIKVFASEMLDYVVDEGVQIHGGYGYHQDYAVERAYRDSRINRIFEGTNEINRLLATGMLLKRAQRGQLPLVEAVKKLQAEVLAGPSPAEPDIVASAKKIGLFLLGAAYQRFTDKIEEQQEVVAGITDVLMNTYALESAILRAKKSGRPNSLDMAQVFAQEAMGWIEASAKEVLAACSEGDALRMSLAVLRRFTKFELENTIALRRAISGRLLQAGRHIV